MKDLCFKIKYEKKYNYYLFFDIKKYMSSLSFSKLLKKIFISQNFIDFLSRFSNKNPLKNFKLYFTHNNHYFFLEKNICLQLFVRTITFHFYYELFTLLDNRFKINISRYEIITFYNNNFLFFLCNDFPEFIRLKSRIIYSVSSKKGRFKANDIVQSDFLSKGVSTDLFTESINNRFNSLDFIFKPSIRSQFLLMRQVALILWNSKSLPIFLLVIRLNMLVVLWLNIYISAPIKKIIYILDYLLYLKFRKIYNSTSAYKYFNVELCKRNQDFYNLSKYSIHFFTIIYNEKYYKLYLLFKLTWVHQLEILKNLREAI